MGRLIWITGFSGVGKSRLAQALQAQLEPKPIVLDGDAVRDAFGQYGYSLEERKEQAFRLARFAHLLVGQELTVICATMSLFAEVQQFNRAQVQDYCEVLLECPLNVLKGRKAIYQGENVVGIDLPYDRPAHPEWILNSETEVDFEQNARTLVDWLQVAR